MLSVLVFTTYDYFFGIFKYLTITFSVLRFVASDYPFDNLKLFLHIVFVHNNLHNPFIEGMHLVPEEPDHIYIPREFKGDIYIWNIDIINL